MFSAVDVQLMPLPGVGDWLPVVASKDCCIRVLGTDGKPMYEIPTASAPTAVRYDAAAAGCVARQAVSISWHLAVQLAFATPWMLHVFGTHPAMLQAHAVLLMALLHLADVAAGPLPLAAIAHAVAAGMSQSHMVGQQHGMPRPGSCCMAARMAAWCSCWWTQVLCGKALSSLDQPTARMACAQPSQPFTVVPTTAR